MFPTISIGSLQLSTYSTVYGLAIFVGCTLGYQRLVVNGVAARHATVGLLLGIWGGIGGAYLGRGVSALLESVVSAGVFSWQGGSTFMGALMGASVVSLVYSRRNGIPLRRTSDLWVLPLPLGQAIGRLGCLGQGCCYGKATDSWLGVYLRDVRGVWMIRCPTQAISSVANLLIFLILLGFEHYRTSLLGKPQGWPFHGFIFLLYIDLYTLKRFGVEFLRGDARPLVGPFTLVHLACLAGFVVATALIWRGSRRAAAERASASRMAASSPLAKGQGRSA